MFQMKKTHVIILSPTFKDVPYLYFGTIKYT